MVIRFSCSECDYVIKAPEDKTGRRIKCPNCQAVQTVPNESVAQGDPPPRASAAVRKGTGRGPSSAAAFDDEEFPRKKERSRSGQDDEDEESSPRRRRRGPEDSEDRPRRPAKSNKGLIIGLCVGGGVVLIGAVVVVILLMSSSEPDKAGANKGVPGARGPGGPPPVDKRLREDLKQIGVAFHNRLDAFAKAPAQAEDLFPFLEGPGSSPSQALTTGRVVFIYNVRLTEMLDGTSNTIIAYERDAPTNGGLVLFGDGAVVSLSAEEFATKTKATPRK